MNPQRTGIGDVMDIFRTMNDPPGLQGLISYLNYAIHPPLPTSTKLETTSSRELERSNEVYGSKNSKNSKKL